MRDPFVAPATPPLKKDGEAKTLKLLFLFLEGRMQKVECRSKNKNLLPPTSYLLPPASHG
jgi:hypothetical protein